MSGRRRRLRAEPTDDWEQLVLLCGCPEQVRYEEIRPLALFGGSVADPASETEIPERTLYRKTGHFQAEGMASLFDAEMPKRHALPPRLRRMIVDLKAEHPPTGLGEIVNVCYAYSGRRPSEHTVKRVLSEEPTPLKMVRRFDPYHEIPGARERRLAVVRLHAEGWTVNSIAAYLKTSRQTVYGVLKRWIEEGSEGLDDGRTGRPGGVRKVDLRAIMAVRELQRNPELGEFRVHAALKQLGIHLSPRTCGRILALNRHLYGLKKPEAGGGARRTMPFASKKRHEYWTTDVRYLDAVDEQRLGGRACVISVLENHSRCVLASAFSRSQDLAAFLSVLYARLRRPQLPQHPSLPPRLEMLKASPRGTDNKDGQVRSYDKHDEPDKIDEPIR